MDHVRRNLTADLALEELARVAYFSPFHFHRVFKATTGETVAAFTRRARLERAAFLMMAAPRRSLSSISIEVGFSSPSDFSRAFRRLYGIPPSSWDRRSRLGTTNGAELACPVSSTDPPMPPPKAQIRQHPTCRLAYVRLRTPFVGEALPRGYERLVGWLERRGVDWRRSRLLGLSWDNYETTPIDQVRFDFGFTVPAHVGAEGEIGIHEFPALHCVDVHCRGKLRRIAQAWDFLYEEWLPQSRYEPDDMPAFKRFRTRPDVLGWEEWDLDCSIAIRRLRA